MDKKKKDKRQMLDTILSFLVPILSIVLVFIVSDPNICNILKFFAAFGIICGGVFEWGLRTEWKFAEEKTEEEKYNHNRSEMNFMKEFCAFLGASGFSSIFILDLKQPTTWFAILSMLHFALIILVYRHHLFESILAYERKNANKPIEIHMLVEYKINAEPITAISRDIDQKQQDGSVTKEIMQLPKIVSLDQIATEGQILLKKQEQK